MKSKKLVPHNGPVHRQVYAFVRDHQSLFVKHGPPAHDPVESMCNWGRALANDLGLWFTDITYDGDMLHFVVMNEDTEELRAIMTNLLELACESGFIKAPYAIGGIERNNDLDATAQGDTVYTMTFYKAEAG